MPRDREGQIYEYTTPGGKQRYGFVIDVGVPGGRRQQTRRQGFETRKAARQERDGLLNEQDTGLYVTRSKIPLHAYLEKWVENREAVEDLRPATVHRYRGDLRRLRVHPIADAPLADLRPTQLDTLYADLLREGGAGGRPLSGTTVRHLHNVIGKALADAVKKGLLARNPATGATAPRRRSIDLDDLPRWSAAQLQQFLESVSGTRWEPFWVLAANTGARRGELLGLRWRDVDLDGDPPAIRIVQAQVEVPGEIRFDPPKTAAGKRRVAISVETANVLLRHRRKQEMIRSTVGDQFNPRGLVFCRVDGEPVRGNSLYKMWSATIKRAGLPHIPFHGLRHTHITLLHQSGEPLRNVSLRVGHEDPSFTLRRYTHPDNDVGADVGQRFEAYVAEAARDAVRQDGPTRAEDAPHAEDHHAAGGGDEREDDEK